MKSVRRLEDDLGFAVRAWAYERIFAIVTLVVVGVVGLMAGLRLRRELISIGREVMLW